VKDQLQRALTKLDAAEARVKELEGEVGLLKYIVKRVEQTPGGDMVVARAALWSFPHRRPPSAPRELCEWLRR
jgi:hypothetical protein